VLVYDFGHSISKIEASIYNNMNCLHSQATVFRHRHNLKKTRQLLRIRVPPGQRELADSASVLILHIYVLYELLAIQHSYYSYRHTLCTSSALVDILSVRATGLFLKLIKLAAVICCPRDRFITLRF
jgi:hypothetical protein